MSTRKHRRTRHPFRGLLSFLLILGAAALFLQWSNTAIQTTHFDPVFADLPEGFDGCRILVLGDLHGTDFGENNEKLLSVAEKAEPDYIFLVGDLLDAFRENPADYAERTAAALSAIAGLPAEIMAVYISINTLCDMGATCVNVLGDIACSVAMKETCKLEEK